MEAQSVITPPDYAPGWMNRVNWFIERLPLPSALTYVLVQLIFLVILTVLRWRDGYYPTGTLSPNDIVMGCTGWFFVALVHYLDNWAQHKLAEYRWALDVTDEQFEAMCKRLTTLPAGPTILWGVVMLAFAGASFAVVGESYAFLNLSLNTASGVLQLANFLFSWWIFGSLFYHAYHQLRVGSQIAMNYLNINLFQLDPLYAFAGLALRTAGGWLIMAYAWALSTPSFFHQPAIAVTVIFMQIVALITFFMPLLGSHAMLEEQKGALQREIGGRVQAVISELNTDIDARSNDELAKLNTKLSSLMMAEERIARIATWPWRPGTLSGLLTAVALPLGLWLVQTLIQQMILPGA